jgi:hypothetical protein
MAHDLLEDTLYISCTCDTVISALTSKDFSSEIGILQSFKDSFKGDLQSVCKQSLCLHFCVQNIELYSTTIYIFKLLEYNK